MKKALITASIFLTMQLLTGCNNKDAVVASLTEREDYHDISIQSEIRGEIEELTAESEYSLENPLMIWNPYGTLSQGLYIYFESETAAQLSYKIEVDGYDDFARTMSVSQATKETFSIMHEHVLIGFIPEKENKVTITLTDDDGKKQQQVFTITPPAIGEDLPIALEKSEGTSTSELTDGLYTMIGMLDTHTFLIDNEGVVRGDIRTSAYRMDRIVEYGDTLLFSNSRTEIAKMNALGELEEIYELDGYSLHHDLVLTDHDTLLLLATETENDSIEDVIVELDLTTGTVEKIVDMSDLLSEYKAQTNKLTEDTSWTWMVGDWDWIHLNTIQFINENEVILSSRETSTIIKLSNIYDEPTLDYLIGEEGVWEETSYKDQLLTQLGEFSNTGGQHSVTYEKSEGLEEGQYYLYLYNNNSWIFDSNLDYSGSVPEGTGVFNNGEKSMYYEYLIDENKGTYELVQSFELPYSSIVSNVQKLEDNLIINSGMKQKL
ncbi:aryl-sulfate sulfotransferase [uncultured Enterococcus sp.]|uniref:aryl-sulfate sulfotransferase n=1 Tax=uncultured Enterococcus sp. TaxID=167972 RepID=UPI002AA8045A|nr:aryl-sulfate sulfotransferase [uncultured Enterococcus sp.]